MKGIFVGFLVLISFNSLSSIVFIDASGSVYSIDSAFSDLVNIDDTINLSITYNPNDVLFTSPIAPNRNFHALYNMNYSLNLGDIVVSGIGGRVEVSNDYENPSNGIRDRIIFQESAPGIQSSNLFDLFDIADISVSLSFYDYDATALNNANFPSPFPLLSEFENVYASIQIKERFVGARWKPIFTDINRIKINTVDEPTTLQMLLLMLALIMIYPYLSIVQTRPRAYEKLEEFKRKSD